MSCHAIRAPKAPTAPKARNNTPVARNNTTIPTPERAYTPPRARPVKMNGWKSCQVGNMIGSLDARGCSAAARARDAGRVLGGRVDPRGGGRGVVLRYLRVSRRDRR